MRARQPAHGAAKQTADHIRACAQIAHVVLCVGGGAVCKIAAQERDGLVVAPEAEMEPAELRGARHADVMMLLHASGTCASSRVRTCC